MCMSFTQFILCVLCIIQLSYFVRVCVVRSDFCDKLGVPLIGVPISSDVGVFCSQIRAGKTLETRCWSVAGGTRLPNFEGV